MKRPKILVVGSLNMDLTASTRRVPNSGETVIGMKFQTAPGGKGLNQAVQCARLGAAVTMIGKVGHDDFGKALLAVAAKSGVDVSRVLTDESESTGVAMIQLEVTDAGTQNRITVCPGANYTITADELSWLREGVRAYDMVIMQFELPMDVVQCVAGWAHETGVPVMINPAPAAPMSDALLQCATFISPNEHEAALLAGHAINVENGIDFDDVRAVAKAFHDRGVENLIITMGGNGSIISTADGIHHTPCVPMPHVADPTAAGDSFVAAFCTAISAGLAQEQALDFASHAAAITVSRMGAISSLPTLSQVQALMRERNDRSFDGAILNALKEVGK